MTITKKILISKYKIRNNKNIDHCEVTKPHANLTPNTKRKSQELSIPAKAGIQFIWILDFSRMDIIARTVRTRQSHADSRKSDFYRFSVLNIQPFDIVCNLDVDY